MGTSRTSERPTEASGGGRCPQCGKRIVRVSGCFEHGLPATTHREPRPPPAGRSGRPTFPGFRVTRVLGWGGFGVVYAVERLTDGARLALKLARADIPGAACRLRREADVLRAVGSPHVPTVHGEGVNESGAPYILMDRIEAPTLAELGGVSSWSIPLRTVVTLANATLLPLEVVHARGRAHGDLKPENILVHGGLRATLLDFGSATAEGGDPWSGVPVGTPEYMTPEQCDGSARLDARTDIYAMGVILYELLTGKTPFWGPAAAVREAHRTRRPPPPSLLTPVPDDLEEVVLRCLAKRPEHRYPHARALRAALHEASLSVEEARPPSSAFRALESSPPPPSSLVGRRRVGLVYLEAAVSPLALQRRLHQLGGELAHIAGRRAVALYSHEVGENPARRALRAAQTLVQEGLCDRARVDLAPVHVQRRRDGTPRYLSAVFQQSARYPGPKDPAGVQLGPAAAAVLSEHAEPATLPPQGWMAPGPRLPDAALSATTEVSVLPLIGRRPLLQTLLRSARDALDGGPPTLTTLIGDVGTGKTRLYQALKAQLALVLPGVIVLGIEPRDHGDGGGALADLLRLALDLPRFAPKDAGEELLTSRLGGALPPATLWPAVALALGWLASDAPALAALSAAPGALRAMPIVVAGEALRARAARGGCAVVIDDAHLCDEAAMAALEHAAREGTVTRLWVCALGRPALATVHPGWGERAAHREKHHLDPLDAESAEALCRQLLLPVLDVPAAAVRRLVERSCAVPLLLTELIRGLKREGLVRRDPRNGTLRLASEELERLPDLPILEWLAERELDALPPALQAHARLVALLGDDIEIVDVSAVLRAMERQGGADQLPLDALAGTERLVDVGLLVRSADERRVAFRHPLLKDAIARGAPSDLKHHTHLAAVDHYRRADSQQARARLAMHAAAAGLDEEAATAYLALGEEACVRHAYLDAEIAFSRAIERGAPLAQAARGRGQMRSRLGRHAEALEDLRTARAQATAAGDVFAEVEILLEEATVLDWIGKYQSARERVRAAQALHAARPLRGSALDAPPTSRTTATHARVEAQLLLGEGRSLHRDDLEKEAAATLERAATAAGALGALGHETQMVALLLLSFILPNLGRLEEGARALDEVVRRCEERGDWMHLGPAMSNRGLLRSYRGDRAGLVSDFERTIAIGWDLGQPMLELGGHFNLAEVLYQMDDLRAAEPHLRAAALTAERHCGGARPAVIPLLEARMRLYQGDEAGAATVATDVRARSEESRRRGAVDAALTPSEDVLCTMIALAGSDAEDAAWDALETRSQTASVGQERLEVLEVRALAALRRGRRDDAARHLLRALTLAERIPNAMRARLERRLAEARATG
ncbi:protein kinase [Chondromyces crocatus]|uniref:Protein kinase n=2 Tax=Chondromyces crocatus TaxID=52 RepID=A0A0K1ESN5_CHOCO|nr:protein kinase [Chondromyces crocatus]